MRQRIIENLPRGAGDSDALAPVQRERFLVYLMGPYRTFDVETLLPADADVETDAPSFATWDETSGEYAERQVQSDPLNVRALVGRGTPAQSRGDRARIGVPKRPEPETLTVVTR